MDKSIIGSIAAIVGLLSYIPYVWNILKGSMRPHAFSWLVWGVLTAVIYVAQVVENGGAGSWVTATTVIGCFLIFILALFKGTRSFPKFDWYSLVGAFVAMFLWWLTNNPLLAVILISIIDVLGFLPTIRKGYEKPYEDSILLFTVGSLKFLVALFALESVNLVTASYPILLVVVNGGFALMLWIRRRQITRPSVA